MIHNMVLKQNCHFFLIILSRCDIIESDECNTVIEQKCETVPKIQCDSTEKAACTTIQVNICIFNVEAVIQRSPNNHLIKFHYLLL